MSGSIHIALKDHILFVELDNPPLNVISLSIRTELARALGDAQSNEDVRVMLFTGAGERAFCAGADLQSYNEGTHTFDSLEAVLRYDDEIFGAIEKSSIPSIAAINGFCIGGGLDFALACDIRICSTNARFRSPGVRLGMIANTARLTKLFGPAVASDLVITGRTVGPEEGLRLGIVSQCVEPADLRETAMELAAMVASRAPLSTAAAKDAIALAADSTYEEGRRRENELYLKLRDTEDHAEAVRAFFAKTEPVFRKK
jgi:enoyl-CoA hydratase/carnithine racemase